jgi:hypothetical protein
VLPRGSATSLIYLYPNGLVSPGISWQNLGILACFIPSSVVRSRNVFQDPIRSSVVEMLWLEFETSL